MAANPFGEGEFPVAEIKQSGVTIPQGEELVLRYRVILHRGSAAEADISGAYRAYAELVTD